MFFTAFVMFDNVIEMVSQVKTNCKKREIYFTEKYFSVIIKL